MRIVVNCMVDKSPGLLALLNLLSSKEGGAKVLKCIIGCNFGDSRRRKKLWAPSLLVTAAWLRDRYFLLEWPKSKFLAKSNSLIKCKRNNNRTYGSEWPLLPTKSLLPWRSFARIEKKAVNTGIASWKNNSFHAALDGRNFFFLLPIHQKMQCDFSRRRSTTAPALQLWQQHWT